MDECWVGCLKIKARGQVGCYTHLVDGMDGWMDGEMYVWDGAGWDGVRWMEWDGMDGWLKEGEGCGRMAYGGWDGM